MKKFIKTKAFKACISLLICLTFFIAYILLWKIDFKVKNINVDMAGSNGEVASFSDDTPYYQALQIDHKAYLKDITLLMATYNNTVTVDSFVLTVQDARMHTLQTIEIPTSELQDNAPYTVTFEDKIPVTGYSRLYLKFTAARPNGDSDVLPVIYLCDGQKYNGGLYAGENRQWGKSLAMGMSFTTCPPTAIFYVVWLLIFALITLIVFQYKNLLKHIHTILWTIVFAAAVFFLYRLGDYYDSSIINRDIVKKEFWILIAVLIGVLLIIAIIKKINIKFDISKAPKFMQNLYEFSKTKRFDRIFGIYVPLALVLVLLKFQLDIVANLSFTQGWDLAALFNCSQRIKDMGIESADLNYLKLYPNNKLLTMVYFHFINNTATYQEAWQKIINLNLALVDIGIVFGIFTARKLFSKTVIYVYLIFVYIMIGLSGWIVIPYSDTFTLCIVSIVAFLFAEFFTRFRQNKTEENTSKVTTSKGKNAKKTTNKVLKFISEKALYILSVLAGILVIIGYFIKPQSLIILIAFAIVFIFEIRKNNLRKSLYSALCIFIAGYFTFFACNSAFDGFFKSYAKSEGSFPASSFVCMGLEENPTRPNCPGIYNFDVIGTQYSTDIKTADKKKYYSQLISEQLKTYGFKGLMGHLGKKYLWIINDGTFFFGREGSFFVKDISKSKDEDKKAKIRDKYIYNGVNSTNYNRNSYVTGIWYYILFLACLAMLTNHKKKREQSDIVWMLGLAFVGSVLFTLLFEGRSRYLINYVPIVCLLAAYSITSLVHYVATTDLRLSFKKPKNKE